MNQPPDNRPQYWSSLDTYNDQADALQRATDEFAPGATEDIDLAKMNPISRRRFLGLVSASAALTTTSCSEYRDKGTIVAYSDRPEYVQVGNASYYASTYVNGDEVSSVLVKMREGRPIKVDGNPEHPNSRGKTSAQAQASIMELFDPERLTSVQGGKPGGLKSKLDWNKTNEDVIKRLQAALAGGREIALVSHGVRSPATRQAINDFRNAYPSARHYEYDLFDGENCRVAYKRCYGRALPKIEIDAASILVSFESNFLGSDGDVVENARLFARRRDVNSRIQMARLYAIEGAMSLTGQNADYRIAMRSDEQLALVYGLINALLVERGTSKYRHQSDVLALVRDFTLEKVCKQYGLSHDEMKQMVMDLDKNVGKSYVLAGENHSVDFHVAVHFLNEILEASKLYVKNTEPVTPRYVGSAQLGQLTARMKKGKVGVVVHLNANPVYHFADQLGYTEALGSVPFVVSLALTPSETTQRSHVVLPLHHCFESWGDAQTQTNIVTLVQPVINPIHDTRQLEGVLLSWTRNGRYTEDSYYKYLRDFWKKAVYTKTPQAMPFEKFWQQGLHDGLVFTEAATLQKSSFQLATFLKTRFIAPQKEHFTVLLQKSARLRDGRFANIGWLQELPHEVTKLCWDNVAAMSIDTAKRLGVENESRVTLNVEGRSVTLPVWIQPGMANAMIAVELGFGRQHSGVVSEGVGVDASVLMSGRQEKILSNVGVTKTSGNYKLASTQESIAGIENKFLKDKLQNITEKRHIIQEGTLAQYRKNPNFIKEKHHKPFNIFDEKKYTGHKWAMSIDLNRCNGCGTCVVSCNAENNIPVVGKDQVAVGREMHWLRIDRYYNGDARNPRTAVQPMLCQHCDNAPCEIVCPVSATTHSDEGLNDMAYNRCVGTRYCANNCAYKVRRYNFFNFRDWFKDDHYETPVANMMHNPEVTVRSRGVMEKCSFCVQRIMQGRAKTITRGKKRVADGVIYTACQQACPTNAIVFGDSNDPKSQISQARKNKLGYHVLEELNVRPNVTYLAKLRNVEGGEKA